MSSVAYAPGLRLGTGVHTGWGSAVVQVSVSFETPSGNVRGLQRGSGFVLADWPDCVLTARHLVVRPGAIPPERMSVQLSAPDAGGQLVRANGIACAYPSDSNWDVALVLLAAPFAPHSLPLCDPRPADQTTFDAEVHGYVPSASQPSNVARRVRRRKRILRYENGPALLGMSGGPVCSAGAAAGIQSFDFNGSGRAILLDFDVLNDCREAAQGIAP